VTASCSDVDEEPESDSSDGRTLWYLSEGTSKGTPVTICSISFDLLLRQTRSHPEMVGDMSRVTLNFDLSKIPFVHF